MKTTDQNLAALEASVESLKPGENLPVQLSDLRYTLGLESEDAAIDIAKEIAQRHNCDFQCDREQGLGKFLRNG